MNEKQPRICKDVKINQWIIKYNPALSKKWLLFLAGAMWTCVGIMLSGYAVFWLTKPISIISMLLGVAGVAISIAANCFQFSKLARKNIERIMAQNDKACAFSFQAWKGYLIIAVMMTGGILLRNSAIPKMYLAVLYTAIGGALFQASFIYYVNFYRVVKPK